MRQIRHIIAAELRAVLTQSKSLLLLFFLVFSYESILSPMRALSLQTALPVQWADPFILLCTKSTNTVLIPVIFTVLLTQFPHCSTRYFQMILLTKTRWLVGELLFLLLMASVTVLVLFAGTLMTLHGQPLSAPEWSPFLLELPAQFPEEYAQNSLLFLDASTAAHGTPLTVFCYTASALTLYLWMLGAVLLLGTMQRQRLAAVIFCLALTVSGGAAIFLDSRLMWLLPLAHLQFGAHFHAIYAETRFPLIGSVGYLAAWLLAAVLLCFGSLRAMQPEPSADEP